MIKRAWLWGGLVTLAAACGGHSASEEPDEQPTAGSSGAPNNSDDDAGVGGGEQPSTELGGAGGGPVVDVEDVGGAGGAAGLRGRVRAAAEQGLTAQDVELDPEAIADRSFTLVGSLCPNSNDAWPNGYNGYGGDSGQSMPGLHVRGLPGGKLEAVTFTSDGGLPAVQVSPMRRAGLGWDMTGIATCARLEGYEDFETNRYEARAMHVVFVHGASPGDLRAVVSASVVREAKIAQLKPDAQAPTHSPLFSGSGSYYVDNVDPRGFGRHILFSEPLSAEAEISVLDANGAKARVEYLRSEDYVVGVHIADWLPEGATIRGVADLAGNAPAKPMPYPGIALKPAHGDFEGSVELLDSDLWIGQAAADCEGGVAESTAGGDIYSFALEPLDLPALVGTQSLLVGPNACTVWLRLERSPAATHLTFRAQQLDDRSSQVRSASRICVRSLGAGNAETCTTLPAPVEDTSYTDSKTLVGAAETISVPLPASGDDLLVGIEPGHFLWLDSLGTE